MGFGGGWTVGLTGQSVLAQGCQNDPACWAETLDTCDDVIKDLAALDPRAYLQSVYDDLKRHDMLRPGDDANFQSIDSYFEERLQNLPLELEQYRAGTLCEYPYVECNGECVPDGQCVDPCAPGEPRPVEPAAGGASSGGAGSEAGTGGIVCPPVINYRLR